MKEEGWLAQHILIRSAATQQLLACMPLYLKVRITQLHHNLLAKLQASHDGICLLSAQHLAFISEPDSGGILQSHSYGEYVFDHSWAALASRVGQRYYVRHPSLPEPQQPAVHAYASFAIAC